MNRTDYLAETLAPGERLLITGGRGSGKTAYLHELIEAHGGLLMPINPHALMTGLAPTVAQEIALGLETTATSRTQLRAEVQDIADRLGIAHLLEANPLELSGGQTQLVALASYLAPRTVRWESGAGP
ncbi:ATP-binding cassette domain-containing protein [Rothia sp. P4278]|uniref:ATP-binding cassette domain-containing protein n=1 Tax=Rothia sp. P4278 TaxID=3402658 RepID=UPI003AE69BD6